MKTGRERQTDRGKLVNTQSGFLLYVLVKILNTYGNWTRHGMRGKGFSQLFLRKQWKRKGKMERIC